MNTRLDELQRIILTEIEIFKLMLVSAGYTTPQPAVSVPPQTKSAQSYDDYEYAYYFENDTNANDAKNLGSNNNYMKTSNNHKTQSKNKKKLYLREEEVIRTNETIRKTDMGKAFIFFWRIADIEKILKEDVELSSPLIEYLGKSIACV